MKRALPVVIALAVVVGVWIATRGEPEREESLRVTPSLPRPDAEAKAAYFFEMMKGGEQVRLEGQAVSAWRAVGRMAVFFMGPEALDYLLAEERLPDYRRTPNRLYSALEIIPRLRGARSHRRLYPFLLHWLDPKNCPRSVPGSDWVNDLRKEVFTVFARFPDEAAVPACIEELKRKSRKHDLRVVALNVLLSLGRMDLVREAYDTLPPSEKEPDLDLKAQLIGALYELAKPAAGRQDQVRKLIPLLRRALGDRRWALRIQAAGALMRLGDASMAERLLDEFAKADAEGDEPWTWAALDALAADGPHQAVRAACLRRLREPDGKPGYVTAVRLLMRWWLHEEDVRGLVWGALDAGRVDPLMVLPSLVDHDRARVVAFLETEVRASEIKRVEAAIRIATGKGVRELGPVLLDIVRSLPAEQRPYFYAALVQLGARRVVPLLVAELDPSRSPLMHGTAATELLNLGERLDVLAASLERGDRAVLSAVQRRAQGMGRDGVPDELLPSILRCLRELPGEEGRLTALYVLRCRGTLDGVRDDLVEAYRREPSRRVANELRAVLVELAHR